MATKRQEPLPDAEWRKRKRPATRQACEESPEPTQAQSPQGLFMPDYTGQYAAVFQAPAPSIQQISFLDAEMYDAGLKSAAATSMVSISAREPTRRQHLQAELGAACSQFQSTLGSSASVDVPSPTRLQQAPSAQPKRGRQPGRKPQLVGQTSMRQFCQSGASTGTGLASPLRRQQRPQLPGTERRLVSGSALPRPLPMVPAPVTDLLGPLQPLTQQEHHAASQATPAARPALDLNAEQTAAAHASKNLPLAVVAGAGTGKTAMLVERMRFMVQEQQVDPEGIKAVTFTNKAAAELKQRLLQHLGHKAEAITACTFHSLAYRIISANFRAAGFTKCPSTVTDSKDRVALVKQAMRLADMDEARKAVNNWLETEGLNWQGLLDLHAELYPRANRELRSRVVTAQRKAKGQARAAPKAAAARKKRAESDQIRTKVTEVQERLDLYVGLYENLARCNGLGAHLRKFADYDSKDKETRKAVKEMAKWLFAVKSCGHTLDMYDPGTYGPDVHEQKHGLVFACYQRLLKIRSLMDFDDHLSKAVEILRSKEDVLRAAREEVQYLLVDEYQDSNPVQTQLINLLQGEAGRITVVGDDAQSIYAFRGAYGAALKDFTCEYSHAQVQRSLSVNYRSVPNILAVADTLRGCLGTNTLNDGYLTAHAAPTSDLVQIMHMDSCWDEARQVAAELVKLQSKGVPLSEMVILFRIVKGQTRPLQIALKDAGLHYQLLGSIGLLDRAVVADALAYLRLAVHPDDDTAFLRIYNKPTRRIGDAAVAALKETQHNLSMDRRDVSLLEVARDYCDNGAVKKFVKLTDSISSAMYFKSPSEMLHYALREACYYDHLEKIELARQKKAEKEADEGDSDDEDEDGDVDAAEATEAGADESRADNDEAAAATATHDEPDGCASVAQTTRQQRDAVAADEHLQRLHQLAEQWQQRKQGTYAPPPASLLSQPAAAAQPATFRPEVSRALQQQNLSQLRAVLMDEGDGEAEQTLASCGWGPLLLQDWLADLATEREDIEQGKKVEAVTISTIHKAKGLEWDVVFLHQCNKGQLPMEFRPADDKVPKPAAPRDAPFRPPDHSEQQQRLLHEQEEHRLAYVGMTRARRMLYLTCLQKQYIPKTRKYVKVEPADFLTRLYDSPLCFCTGLVEHSP